MKLIVTFIDQDDYPQESFPIDSESKETAIEHMDKGVAEALASGDLTAEIFNNQFDIDACYDREEERMLIQIHTFEEWCAEYGAGTV